MSVKRSIIRIDHSPPERHCQCGRLAVFALITLSEMRGKYIGTGKMRQNRTYRCQDCMKVVAVKFDLEIPPAKSS